MPFVYSTATNSGTYIKYKSDHSKGHGHSEVLKKVTIQGGHGVATKALVTPKGVVTKVTQEELDFLMENESFKRHLKAGFMAVDSKKVDPADKAANMAPADNSAPLTPADFEKGENSTEETKIFKGRSRR